MHEQPPVATHPDVLNDQLEQEQQASLFEQYADQEFEIYGQRGSLQQLLDQCPVPANQRSFAATERFTAKVLEQHGVDIPESFAHLRSEKKPEPVEPKQTEAKRDQPVKIETPTPTPAKEVPAVQSQIPEEVLLKHVVTTPELPLPVEQEPIKHAQSVENALVQLDHIVRLEDLARANEPSEVVPTQPQTDAVQPTIEVESRPTKLFERPKIMPTGPLEVLQAELDTDAQPVPQDTEVSEYVGAVYREAAAEVNQEGSVDYEAEPETVDQLIAEILGIEIENLQTSDIESISLPPVEEDSILNMLSIEENNTISATQAETEVVKPTIIESIPVALAQTYHERILELPPEEAEPLQALVEMMTLISERLQVLVVEERAGSPEAIQIEAVLEEYYDELCTLLNMPIDAEERRKFIATIRRVEMREAPETATVIADDEGTHEFKHGILPQAHQLPVLLHQTINLARYMISMGLNPQSQQLS